MDLVLLSTHGWHGGGFFMFFFGLIFLLIVFKLFVWRGYGGRGGWGPGWHHHYGYEGPAQPEEILKGRLAKGEITEDDYQRLLDKVKQ